MNGDPRLRERFDRAARSIEVDTARQLDRVRRAAERRDRSRRVQALAVAAAIGILALVVTWQLRSGGGSAVPLGSGPVGRIAFLGSEGVSLLDLATGEVSPVGERGESVTAAAWSPDGARLAIGYSQEGVRSWVVVSEPDGSDPVTVFDEGDSGLVGPDLIDLSWSSDGAQLAVAARAAAHGRTILIVDAAGEGTKAVLDGHWESVSWSPDGERLVAVGFPQLEGGRFDVYTMRPDGSDLEQLTDDDAVEHNPSWSPDGTRIVFDSGEDYERDVYVMDADGSDRYALASAGLDFFPVWSPDGTWIAFASDRDATEAMREANRSGEQRFVASIHVMRPDGSDLHRVAGDGTTSMFPVSWAP